MRICERPLKRIKSGLARGARKSLSDLLHFQIVAYAFEIDHNLAIASDRVKSHCIGMRQVEVDSIRAFLHRQLGLSVRAIAEG